MIKLLEDGLKNCRLWFGDCKPSPVANTGASPYFMVYGTQAVLHADIAFRSPRVENFDADRSKEARELEVNCSKERRLTLVCVQPST
jgi:hypothetical protein